MEFIFLAILGAIGVGSGLGIIRRNLALRRLRQSKVQKPAYNIEDDLTPAEFGYVLDGAIGRDELLGELLWLHNKGVVRIRRDDNGDAVIETTLHAPPIPDLDETLLKNIFTGPNKPIPLRHALSTGRTALAFAVEQSLHKKGWVKARKPYLGGTSVVPRKIILLFVILIVLTGSVSLMGATLLRWPGEVTYIVIVLSLTVICLLSVMAGLYISARSALLDKAGMIMHTTAQYQEKWHATHGVYIYLRVSGNDIFSPDYETLQTEKVDKLYPYLVAAGLDKKLYRHL